MPTANYFADITEDPISANLKLIKAKLAATIIRVVQAKGWKQTAAAKNLGISQPRLSNLFNGYIDKFSIDSLLEILGKLGYVGVVLSSPSNEDSPLKIELKKAEI